MKFLILAALLVSAYAISIQRENIESLSVEHVEFINSLNTTWKAGHNFKGLKLEDLKKLCGSLDPIFEDNYDEETLDIPIKSFSVDISKLPEEFDSRKQWPKCADLISHIRDQGSCGSCWAVAAASAISDRLCVAFDGEKKIHLSEQILNSCCDYCYKTEGCQGGNPANAWLFWVNEGLVSGGDFGSKTGCQPYSVEPCEHHVDGSRPKCGEIVPTPKCLLNACTNPNIDFFEDTIFGKSAFRLSSNVDEIKTELIKRGPLEASFRVYDDFFLYKSGVYQVTEGAKEVGGHAVEVIGFGKSEDGTEYWLAKNSWNTDWGDNGYFKIKMGEGLINKGFTGGIIQTE